MARYGPGVVLLAGLLTTTAGVVAPHGRQDVPAAAKESIQDTTDAASHLFGPARIDLLHDAVTSFDVAARWSLAVCMAAVLLAAAGAAIGLSGATPAKR